MKSSWFWKVVPTHKRSNLENSFQYRKKDLWKVKSFQLEKFDIEKQQLGGNLENPPPIDEFKDM